MLGAIPLVPDGDEARRWAEDELAKTAYAEARPTLFDQWSRSVAEFVVQLFDPRSAADLGPVGLIIVCIVVVAALVVVLIIWGRPRRSFRRPRRIDLLGSDDARTAAQLRADAERSAKAGDWDEAIVLRYRAVARSMVERDLITPAPGATAQRIARDGGEVFAALADPLVRAAASFDDVRYLRHPGTEARYRDLAETDARLQSARLEPVPA
ncbi:hypothetical protein J2Y69_000948 [Microbacterium resistens]|uniref:Protein-glutamine gamma-glutamyltransferase-like C-terminal domain-containing protein n=1 Tax=Microbacterium resistens TaxID=156977 RepID=A0ABU1S9R9_9MICO|nr:DUF4129 domain-containing protein [Microbacterium resistens]MDR6866356.1 hypothetical protein [Microbacterium resistens]